MAHQGVLFSADKTKTIPVGFAEKALGKFPSAFGLCVIDPADNVLTGSVAMNPDRASLLETSTNLVDPSVVYYLGNHPEGSDEEDIQPWLVLSTDAGDPLAYAFAIGAFPGSVKTDSSHSDAYHFVNDYLAAKLKQMLDVFEGDAGKLMKYCDQKAFRDDILNGAVGPSAICLMFSSPNDKVAIKLFVKSLDPIEFDFGWTTDSCGYLENVGEVHAAKTAEDKPLPAALRAKASLIAGGAAPPPVPPKPTASVIPLKQPTTATASAPDSKAIAVNIEMPKNHRLTDDGQIMYKPFIEIGNKARKKVIQKTLGYLPNTPRGDWEEKDKEWPLNDAMVNNFIRGNPMLKAEVERRRKAAAGVAAKPADKDPARKVGESTVVQGSGVVTATGSGAKTTGTVPPAAEKSVPITANSGVDKVTETALKNFMPEAKRFIDPLSNEIINPKELQGKELPVAAYFKSLGIDGINNTVRWPPEAYKLLGQKSLDALVDMVMSYRFLWLATMDQDQIDKLNPSQHSKRLPAALAAKVRM